MMDLRKKLRFVSLAFSLKIKKRIKKSKIKTVLILRYDRIGDMVVTTPLIRALHQNGYEVSTISQKDSIDFISKNPYVKNTYIWSRDSNKFIKNILAIRKNKYDIAIDMREQLEVKTFLFSLMTGARYLVGFNKENIRGFDKSIFYNNPNNHITMKMDAVLKEVFDIHGADLSYDAFVDDEIESRAITFYDSFRKENEKVIVINPFASLRERDMSYEQLSYLIEQIKIAYHEYCIVLIGNLDLLEPLRCLGVNIFESETILDVIPVIKYSDLVVTVDTAALHIAGAFNKKIVALYGLFYWDEHAQWLKWDFFNSKALPENFDIKNYLHNNEHAWGVKTNNISESLYSERGRLINTIPKEDIASTAIKVLNL
nr:glycosyltransferase family 9 protein [Erwinia sp. Ejp617]